MVDAPTTSAGAGPSGRRFSTGDVVPPLLWTAPWRLFLSPLVLFRTSVVMLGALFVVRTVAIIVEGVVDVVFVLADGAVLYGWSVGDWLIVAQRWGRVWLSVWMLIVVVPRLVELHQQSLLLTDRMGVALSQNRNLHRRPVVVLLLLFVLGTIVTGVWQSFPGTWSQTVLALHHLWHSVLPGAGPLGQWLLGPNQSLAHALLSSQAIAWDTATQALPISSLLAQLVDHIQARMFDLTFLLSSNTSAFNTWMTLAHKLLMLGMMVLCHFFAADHVLENPIYQDLPGPAPSWIDMANSVWRIFPPFRVPRESRERFGDILWSNISLAVAIMPDVLPENTRTTWFLVLLYCTVASLVQRLSRPHWAILQHLSIFSVYLLHFIMYSWLTLPISASDGQCGPLCERSRVDRVDVIEDIANRCARMATQNLMHLTILTLMGWHMNTKGSESFDPHLTSHLIYGFRQIARAPFYIFGRVVSWTFFAIVPVKLYNRGVTLTQNFLHASLATSGNRRRQASVRNLSLHVGVMCTLATLTWFAYRLHKNVESTSKSDVLQWLDGSSLYSPSTVIPSIEPGVDVIFGMKTVSRTSTVDQSLLPACQFVFNHHPAEATNKAYRYGPMSPNNQTFQSLPLPGPTEDNPFVPDRVLRIQHLSAVADVVYGNVDDVSYSIEKLEYMTGLRFQETLVDGFVNIWRQRGATVVAFRGTSSGGDILSDVRMFLASVGLQFVLQSLPVIAPWRLLLTDDIIASLNLFLLRNQLVGVDVLNSMIKLPRESSPAGDSATVEGSNNATTADVFRKFTSDELFQEFAAVANDILRFIPRTGPHKVFLVGHSLGGAVSQVVAHFLVELLAQQGRSEVFVVPVAFNSPGIVWSQRLFGVHHPSLLERAININAAQDIVSNLDPPQANVQTLKCNNGPLLCHSMYRINCQLWQECSGVQPVGCDVIVQDDSSHRDFQESVPTDPVRKVYLFLQLRWLLCALLPLMLIWAGVVTQPLQLKSRRSQMLKRSSSFSISKAQRIRGTSTMLRSPVDNKRAPPPLPQTSTDQSQL